MKDPRLKQLAKNIINYSVDLKKDEKVLIEFAGLEVSFLEELINEVYNKEGIPFVSIGHPIISRAILKGSTVEGIKKKASYDLVRMKDMDVYIGVRSGDNVSELSDVPQEKMKIYMEHYGQVVHSKERVENTKWCVLRYPNPSMAQLAEKSTRDFEDFYFKVCNLDYAKMSKAMDGLVELMEKTDKVRIIGEGTSISFSIKGMPAIKCDGKYNIPDGEVFTAPLKESANGEIFFNAPTHYQGDSFENIFLKLENGKIIEAKSNKTKKLNDILDTDIGARHIGEFAIGLNPYIEYPMKDILFDEKIKGSFHFTPGSAYGECDNGNKSAIHWDMVCIQTPDYGGGEIYFDEKLIRKDGKFVIEELKGLNPENLV